MIGGKTQGEKYSRTRNDIKQGLIKLLETKHLEEVTMSELARVSHVSRNTLYRHYRSIPMVYGDIVSDFTNVMSKALARPDALSGGQASLRPFCEIIRSAGDFGAIKSDPRFIDVLFEEDRIFETHPMYRTLIEAGYSPEVAEGMVRFHTQGCFKAASWSSSKEESWLELRSCIDTFVKGGLDACVQQKKSQPSAT